MNMMVSSNAFAQANADLAAAPARRAAHDPHREIWIGGALVAFLLLGVGTWTVSTRLDAAVISPGVVRVSGGRQTIQTSAGGIISAVHVRDGAVVRQGQTLIQFTTAEADAQERALATRAFALQAEVARITAEMTGQNRVAPPASFATLATKDQAVAARAIALEQAQLDAQRQVEASERSVLRDQSIQIDHQIDGYGRRLASAERQGDLNQQELDTYEDLLARGLTTKPRVLALRRSAAAISGETGATTAEMARLRGQAGEARLRYIQTRNERTTLNAERLRTAQTELQAVLPQWQAARDQLARTIIRAPFAGTVTGLRTQASGAIVPAGASLLELVPTQGNLVVETRVSTADASDLKAGQPADVRLSALHGRILPPLHGRVESVSADSVQDEKTGQSYYTATVRISRAEVDSVTRQARIDGGIRAGTPVEVVVATQQRSVLDFLISPLASRMSGTFAQR